MDSRRLALLLALHEQCCEIDRVEQKRWEASLARQVGYDSDAAFSRAFKKLTGVAPAAWRQRRPTSQH